ncbi:MAG TPA: DUF4221 family protein [Algoriphagus sp.]|nr:DUF4221 family protein [Algoriphagus sp.]
MKNPLKLLAIAVLFSCSENEEKSSSNILENLKFTVDTVVVDPGDDFLNLSRGLWPYTLTKDKSQLYFFEISPFRLVQVDLDQLKVLKKTPFEEEGPNGIGSYLSGLEIAPNGNLFLKSNATVGVFDQAAKKLQDLKFVPSGIDSALAENSSALYSRAVYDFETGKIYTQPTFQEAGEYSLFILNPETQSARSLPIPKMKIVGDYSGTITIKSGKSIAMYFYSVASFFTFFPGELFVTNSAMSGIYRYNSQTEQLEFIDIQHQTVPNLMDVEIIKNPTKVAQAEENQQKILEQLNYMELIWDDSRQMYFRFGEKSFKGANQGDPVSYEIYLFAYDKDFKVLGETLVEDLKTPPRSSFFKNGKLWSFVNVDDELGFAVIDFKF